MLALRDYAHLKFVVAAQTQNLRVEKPYIFQPSFLLFFKGFLPKLIIKITKRLPWQALAPSTTSLAIFSLYAKVRIHSGAFFINRKSERIFY
jgi:hypothetical protein